MKKIITILALGISGLYNSQIFNPERIKEDNLSKEQNYSNALSWTAIENKEFRLKKITASDSYTGMVSILVTAYLGSGVGVNYGVDFNIKIEVKDNRYRVSYINPVFRIEVKNEDYTYMSSNALKRIKENLLIIESLSTKKFNKKLEWNYDDVNKAKNDYALSVNEINVLVDLLYKLEDLQKKIDKSIDETMVKNNNW
ncbi:hypothetical protein BAS10_06665 [Elizabethkingia meningoseptica]|uniref:hypothetical protein n=1 Tax=Elizabethkingia meningoseptica TaxID=238 RepID=UPI00099AE82F|nr:hypothetical protein [Elizabethkingia meningoseptica]OPB96731.1 hypothetical protein BAS10_06665 [Elizabethkingia meningoseptica]